MNVAGPITLKLFRDGTQISKAIATIASTNTQPVFGMATTLLLTGNSYSFTLAIEVGTTVTATTLTDLHMMVRRLGL